jgi:hypothetical protein
LTSALARLRGICHEYYFLNRGKSGPLFVRKAPFCETEFCEALHYSGFLINEQTCSGHFFNVVARVRLSPSASNERL